MKGGKNRSHLSPLSSLFLSQFTKLHAARLAIVVALLAPTAERHNSQNLKVRAKKLFSCLSISFFLPSSLGPHAIKCLEREREGNNARTDVMRSFSVILFGPPARLSFCLSEVVRLMDGNGEGKNLPK